MSNDYVEEFDDYVLESLFDDWFSNIDELYKNWEKEAEDLNVELGMMEMKYVMLEAKKRGYDGIKFGDYEMVYYGDVIHK